MTRYLIISRHCLKSFLCSNSFQIWSSLLVLDIACTVSRLKRRVNLQVHFKFAFGILFPSTWRVLIFPEKNSKPNKQRLPLSWKYLHDIDFEKTTTYKYTFQSSNKHNWCISDIYCNLLSAQQTLLFEQFSIVMSIFQFFWIKISGMDRSFLKEADWNAIPVRYWLHSTLKFAIILS